MLVEGLVRSLLLQHAGAEGWLEGLHATPSRKQWGELRTIQLVPKQSDAALQQLVAVQQAQVLEVALPSGQQVAVPAQAVALHLPADHSEVVITGLLPCYVKPGVTEAFLAAVGYVAGPAGCVVVHERRGIAAGLGGVPLPGGRLDTVVAVVRTPPGDRGLRRLPPRVVVEGGGEARVSVSPSIAASPPFTLRAPPSRTQVQRRVAAAHGLTAAVLAAAPPPIAEAAVRAALPPGSRTGLGFGAPLGAAPPPPPAPPAPAPPSPELPMPAAEVPEPAPADEPGFGAALQHLGDSTDLGSEAQLAIVHAVRTHSPQLYAACREASRPSDLTRGFRAALHAQAVALVGEAAAAGLWVEPRVPVLEACLPAGLLGAMSSEAGAAPTAPRGGEAEEGEGGSACTGPGGLGSGVLPSGGGEECPAAGLPSGSGLRRSCRTHRRPQDWWEAKLTQQRPHLEQHPSPPEAAHGQLGQGRRAGQ